MAAKEPSNKELLEAIRGASQEQKSAIEELREEVRAATAELRTEINKVKEELTSTREDITDLRTLNKVQQQQIKELQSDVNYLKQKDVAHKVILFGVPRSADPKKVTESIAQVIGVGTQASDISFCARLKQINRQPGRPPLILVGFVNHIIAEKFVAAQKKFGPVAINQLEGISTADGEPSTIRADYFLTNYFIDLLKKAKEIKEKLQFKFAWYKNCAIYLKKQEGALPLRIASPEHLIELTE